jgi:hypothetical protein
MAIGQSPDELNIGLGLEGYEDLENKLERLQRLLNQTAETADRAFSKRSSSEEDLAVRLANIDKGLSATAARYASLGRAGASSFDQINRSQLEAIERIAVLQGRLRDLEERRTGSKGARALGEITKEAKVLEGELTIVQRKLASLQTLDIAAKLKSKYLPTDAGKIEFQGPASPYEPGLKALSYTDPDLDKTLKDIERMTKDREKWNKELADQEIRLNNQKYQILTQQLKNYLSDSVSLNKAHVKELNAIANDTQIQDQSRRIAVLSSKYGAIGKPGSSDFSKINTFKEEQLDKLIALQLKLKDLERQRGDARLLGDLERISREAQDVTKQINRIETAFNRIKPIDVKIKATYVPSKEGIEQKIQFQGPASAYRPGLKDVAAKTGDKDLTNALKDIERMERDRLKWSGEISKQEINQREQTYKTSLSRLKNFFKDELSLLKAHIKEKNKITSGTAGGRYIGRSTRGPLHDVMAELGLPGLSGALGPIAAVAGVGYAAQKAFQISQTAVERASEQAKANRTLASSAAEAGIQLDVLTEKNKKFAEQTALSTVKATSTSARIAQLATISQRTDEQSVNKLFEGFADLGAARGLDAEGIETVIQQIITGQDEGYKKLLLPNPSQLQARFAQKNNRTVSSLTAVEKAQIFQDNFLEKAKLFNGAAEARLQSLDGKAAQVTSTFENMANSLSTAFVADYDFQEFMKDIIGLMKEFTIEVEDLAKLAEQGINIDVKIKQQSEPGTAKTIFNYAKGGVEVLGAGLGNAMALAEQMQGNYVDAAEYAKAAQNLSDAAYQNFGGDKDSREAELRQLVNAEIRMRAIQRRLASERAITLAGERAEEDKLKKANTERDRIQTLYKRQRTTPEKIQETIQTLNQYEKGGTATLDFEAANKEIDKRFNERDIREDARFGGDANKVKNEIAIQVVKEFQEALEVSNLPLFDEKSLADLRERGYEELSSAVSKIYNRVLSDPNLNIGKLFSAMSRIKGDERLFPDAEEALLQEAEGIRQRFAQKAEDTRVKYGDLLADFHKSTTDNPLVDFFYNGEKAAIDAYNTFSVFGEGFAKMASDMARQTAQAKIELETFNTKQKSLTLTQEARRLDRLEPDQYAGFQTRLSGLTAGLAAIAERSQFNVGARRDARLATRYRVFPEMNQFRQLQIRADQGEDVRAERQQLRLQRADIKDRIREADDAKSRFDKIAEKFGDLGIEGKGAVARARLQTLPSTDELLQLAALGGGRQAKSTLRQRSELQNILAKDQDRQLEKVLRDQEFNQFAIKQAQERVALLDREGTRLGRGTYLDQVLNITGEIPVEDLPADLKNLRVRALDEKAKIENTRAEEANKAVLDIKNSLDGIKTSLEKGGLKIDIKEKAIIEVHDKTKGRIRVTNSKYEQD